MSKRVIHRQILHDPVLTVELNDDIWTVIVSFFEEFDVVTLLNFISVSKRSIGYVTQQLRDIFQFVSDNIPRYPGEFVYHRLEGSFHKNIEPFLLMMGLLDHSYHYMECEHQYKLVTKFILLYKNNFTTETASIILSILNLALLQEKYFYSVDKQLIHSIPGPMTPLKNIYGPYNKSPSLYQYCRYGVLSKHINIMVGNYKTTQELIKSNEEKEILIKRVNLSQDLTKRYKRFCPRNDEEDELTSFIAKEAYKATVPPKEDSLFKDVFISGYSIYHENMASFRTHCFVFDNSDEEQVNVTMRLKFRSLQNSNTIIAMCWRVKDETVVDDRPVIPLPLKRYRNSQLCRCIHFSLQILAQTGVKRMMKLLIRLISVKKQ